MPLQVIGVPGQASTELRAHDRRLRVFLRPEQLELPPDEITVVHMSFQIRPARHTYVEFCPHSSLAKEGVFLLNAPVAHAEAPKGSWTKILLWNANKRPILLRRGQPLAKVNQKV